ncbi:hypothetical protein FB451DRAFT_1365071 [Mycena latifolia]|nr:hypothetical protein FB451DRAFT_1365071 [Mycena latifolia]
MPSLTLFWVFAFCVTMLPLYVATGSTDSCGKDCRGNAAVCTTSPCNKCGIIFPEDYYVDTVCRMRVPSRLSHWQLYSRADHQGISRSRYVYRGVHELVRLPGGETYMPQSGRGDRGKSSSFVGNSANWGPQICSPCKNSQECHSANPAFPVFYQRKCIPKCKTNEDCSMGTASVCNTTSGLCIRGCSFQSDCKKEGFKTCFQPGTYGECVPDCTTNSDCPKATPTCYQTECGGFCGKPRCQRNIRCDRHSYCANPDFTSENLGHDA